VLSKVPDTFDRTPSIGFGELGGSQLDAWRYMLEVRDGGKPADVTGYR